MKALLTLLMLMMASGTAHAGNASESIATGGALDPVVRVLTPCSRCSEMENLRRQAFWPAHRDIRREKGALEALQAVENQANFLRDRAENDRINFRGAHYADEVKSFFYLVADSFQYTTEPELLIAVAYINNSLGSRALFDQVMSDEYFKLPHNQCRRQVFVQAVNYHECEFENGYERDAAKQQRRPAKLKKCGILTISVKDCEARQAAKRQVK